ncbi:hypothetical protein [Methylobacterium sp. Gmos1]
MTVEELVQGLGALFGATGVGAVAIAYLAHKTEVAKGRRGEPEGRSTAIAVGGALADRASFDAMTEAVQLQTAVLTRLVELLEGRELREQKEDDEERMYKRFMERFSAEHAKPMSPRAKPPQ